MKCKLNKRHKLWLNGKNWRTYTTPQVACFKYFGSNIGNDAMEIEEDVNHRIHIGWLKQKNVYDVIYDRKVPIKFKRNFYCTNIKLCCRDKTITIDEWSHKTTYDKKWGHKIESWGSSNCREKIEVLWKF